MWNPANASQITHLDEIQVAARVLGLKVQSVEVREPNEFESAFLRMMRDRPDALYMTADPVHQLHVGRIIDFVAKSRLPAMYQVPHNAVAGASWPMGRAFPSCFGAPPFTWTRS